MITTTAKYFFGLAIFCCVGAILYGWGSGGGFSGAFTLGLYGSVGEHAGYIAFLTLAATSLLVGCMVIAFRDADAEATTALYGFESVPEVEAPSYPSWWPLIGAVAAACIVLGLVVSAQLFVLGLVIAGVVLLEWLVAAWSDRATGDPAVNRRIRTRVMAPFEIPVFGAIAAVVLVVSLSRLLLALDKNGSAIAAIVMAAIILGLGALYALLPRSGRAIVTVVCVLLAAGVITAGIISAAQGSRNFEKEENKSGFLPPDRRQPTPTTAAEEGGQ